MLAACFAVAMIAGWTWVAAQIDAYAYDFLFHLNPPPPVNTRAVIVALDDAGFQKLGGVRRLRGILADALERIADAHPKAVAVDVILQDEGDASEDARLARAFARTPNLILATYPGPGAWADPNRLFAKSALVLGDVTADEGKKDGVTRAIPLEKIAYGKRRWAMSLEAFRLARNAPVIIESPEDLQVGNTLIPARFSQGRPLRIMYSDPPPQFSVLDLGKPDVLSQIASKIVFIGVTSGLFGDRITTPNGGPVSGIEIHGQMFETLERGRFLTGASNASELAFCAIVTIAAGLIFAFLTGWAAYAAGAALLATAHLVPFLLFKDGVVFPYFSALSSAWLTVAGAATYQSLVVRRQLRKSEIERTRYRQAIHFVTHEMRSPLTAIQGSSELIGRYNLNDEKRRQIADMINSESKRLARMIQTFLDVERLSDGQMEVRREPVAVRDLIDSCVLRVMPLAERKSISIAVDGPVEGEISGDRELMEYAVYNLLTNAVKYSPPGTAVTITSRPDGGHLRLSVRDQGMGMNASELKQIFQRFYRTRRAEMSGEAGTGIGLSIVEQIVTHHGGRMEVTSAPGKGSCFTAVLPQHVAAPEGRGVAH